MVRSELRLLKQITSIPTAPFVEDRVYRFVDQFVRQHRLSCRRDEFGNVLVTRAGQVRSAPRLVLVAHTDHPGLVAGVMADDDQLIAYFRGGVLNRYVRGAKVVFFDGNRKIFGKVTDILDTAHDRPTVVQVRVKKPVASGCAGMFDLGEARVVGKLLKSRACDDLAGLAGCLAAVARKPVRPLRSDLCVLLTRGEEVGFVGALAAIKHKTLLRKTDRVISIECSAEQPVARQGQGVVLRVGDRTSVFHSALSHFIHTLAQDLQKADKTFLFQRALMPGGTCEATPFDAFGHIAAAVCVPLGNYHNMNTQTKRLAPETVHLHDWANMVELFVELARRIHQFKPNHAQLRAKLTGALRANQHLLRPTHAN